MSFSIFPTGKLPNQMLTNIAELHSMAGRRESPSVNSNENAFSPEAAVKVASNKIMHINNLPHGANETGISNMCSNYGEVLLVKFIHPRACLVTFKSSHSVDEAIQKINADTTLGWKASHKKYAQSSPCTTSDSDSSQAQRMPAIDRSSTKSANPAIEGHVAAATAAAVAASVDDGSALALPLNWSLRKFSGPFTHPTPITLPRGTKLTMFHDPADRPHYYKDDPAVIQRMRQMAAASGGQHSKLEYTFHSAGNAETTCLKPLDRQSEGPCVRCQTISMASCENCGDFYCSVECQRADWHQHRPICLPMPRLVGPKNDAKKLTTAIAAMTVDDTTDAAPAVAAKPVTIARYPLPSNNTDVIITYAVDHRRIFIRSADATANQDYIQTLLDASEAGLTARPLAVLPARGDVVLASFDGMFQRALVIAEPTDAERIECAYLDHGNKQTLRLGELYEIPATLAGRMRHPVEVLLADVGEAQVTDGETTLLVDLIDAATRLRLSFDVTAFGSPADGRLRKTGGIVRLTVAATNECINDTLALMNRVDVVALSEPPQWMHELQRIRVNGTDVPMVVMDNSLLKYNMLSCVRQTDLAELVLKNRRFQEYCGRATGPYAPRVNELCFAQCKGTWYRASCIETVGDRQPTLQLIDYGNMMHVNIDDIRKMPTAFTYALITNDYMLEGIETIGVDELHVLCDFLAIGNVVVAEKVETIVVDKEVVFKLHCDAVLQLLREKGLLAPNKAV